MPTSKEQRIINSMRVPETNLHGDSFVLPNYSGLKGATRKTGGFESNIFDLHNTIKVILSNSDSTNLNGVGSHIILDNPSGTQSVISFTSGGGLYGKIRVDNSGAMYFRAYGSNMEFNVGSNVQAVVINSDGFINYFQGLEGYGFSDNINSVGQGLAVMGDWGSLDNGAAFKVDATNQEIDFENINGLFMNGQAGLTTSGTFTNFDILNGIIVGAS